MECNVNRQEGLFRNLHTGEVLFFSSGAGALRYFLSSYASAEFLSPLGNAQGHYDKSPRRYIWSAVKEILELCCFKISSRCKFTAKISINNIASAFEAVWKLFKMTAVMTPQRAIILRDSVIEKTGILTRCLLQRELIFPSVLQLPYA